MQAPAKSGRMHRRIYENILIFLFLSTSVSYVCDRCLQNTVKSKDDSMEDLGVSPAERQVKIKARLRKFFHKRPSMELLVKKGIWKGKRIQ